MRFEFATATRILFGLGRLDEVSTLTAEMGRRVFIVTGHTVQRAEPLIKQLKQKNLETVIFNVQGEPTTDLVLNGVDEARQSHCDMVIGIGGGSVLDTGKAVAALLANEGDLFDYLEVIGRGRPLKRPSAPCIAIPTTSGTGTEVTRNAVLTSPRHRIKVSLRSLTMLPRLAVIDPLLTHSLSPEITASTGLDALTQLIEPYVSRVPNPLIDPICLDGIVRVARSLRKAYDKGDDESAREDMALASLFSGLALANAKLGAVHGIAGPMGGMIPVPHGVACARLLPIVMMTNIKALESRFSDSPVLKRYGEIAKTLTGESQAESRDGVRWIQDLCQLLNIPGLSQYGLAKKDFPELVGKVKQASSMKGNPIDLTDEEILNILNHAMGKEVSE
ncbi:iron-containing alcohol dehydrogenase [bacterium]|nr:iron-containing alcohol dehydrogenase [bacterium]